MAKASKARAPQAATPTSTPAPAQPPAGGTALLLLSLALLLAPALGVPGEELLQDTLKSAIVAFGALLATLVFMLGLLLIRDGAMGLLPGNPSSPDAAP